MTGKIKISTLDILLTLFTIIQLQFIPYRFYVLLRYVVIGYLFGKYFKTAKDNKSIIALLVAYGIALSYSTLVNTSSFTWVLSAIMEVVNYIAIIYVYTRIGCNLQGIQKLIVTIVKALFVILFINDLLMIFLPYNLSDPNEMYLVGNKFQVSFLHALQLTLLYTLHESEYFTRDKIMDMLWLVYSFVISMVVHCTTGIIVYSVIVVLKIIPKWTRVLIEKPYTFIAALSIENILIWGSIAIFKHPIVRMIVVDVFHKSPNMTGRDNMYAVTMKLVQEQPWFGYGHNTVIYKELFGYGNAQNGLFHIITQAGIIGAVIYFLAISLCLINKNKNEYSYNLYIYVFAMVVGSAVEINLSKLFLLGVFILYAINKADFQVLCKYNQRGDLKC